MNVIDAIFWKDAAARKKRMRKFDCAVADDDIDLVRQMLAGGMDPNQVLTASNGERPLHVAAAFAGREMIDCLLQAGAGPARR